MSGAEAPPDHCVMCGEHRDRHGPRNAPGRGACPGATPWYDRLPHYPVAPELLERLEGTHGTHSLVLTREAPGRVLVACEQCKQVLGVLVPEVVRSPKTG